MNQEIVMMFNTDEVEKMAVTTEGEVTPDGVIAAFYDEMQRSIQVDENAQIVVDPQQLQNAADLLTFKEADLTEIHQQVETPQIETSQEEPMIIEDGNQVEALPEAQVSEEVDEDGKVKTVEIPNTWDISILESNNTIPHSAEPIVEADNQTCQLWECPKCTALFRDKDVCEHHIERSHSFTCGLCNEPFEEKENFELHIIKHISEIPGHILQKIDEGKTAEPEPAHVAPVHESIENNEDNAVIDVVGNGEAQKEEEEEMDSPMAKPGSASKEEPSTVPRNQSQFVCDLCDVDCFTQNSLLLHMKKRHSNYLNKDHICPDCGKRFRWKLSLENHQTIHHKKQKHEIYSCHVCGEEYQTAEELDQHMPSHQDKYPFSCDFCGAKYKQSSSLVTHIKKIHPEGKVFACKECKKCFKTKGQLDAHVAEVHNIKTFTKCRFCQKLFETSEEMADHVQTFHLRKPQKTECDYCSESFVTSKELSKHMDTHVTTIQKFECNLCNETFSHQETFQMHLKQKHQ